MTEHKENLNFSISDGQNIIWRTGLKDNQLNSNLHNLTLFKRDMFSVIHDAIGISNKMKDIHKNATTIKKDIQYKLRPELDKLQKSGVEIVSLGEEKCKLSYAKFYLINIINCLFVFVVSVAERNIKTSIDILISLEKNNYIKKTEVTNWNVTIGKKMDELKSRILKAKQAADGVSTKYYIGNINVVNFFLFFDEHRFEYPYQTLKIPFVRVPTNPIILDQQPRQT